MLHRMLVAFLATLFLLSPGFADDTNPGSTLTKLLAGYDRQGGGNTIPIEKEILRLREAGARNALIRHLDHHRFGATIAWALAEGARATDVRSIVGMARACWPDRLKGAVVSTLAQLPGEESLKLLREFQADEAFPQWARFQLQGALLSRRAEDVKAAVEEGLAAKDVGAVSEALRTIAESYDARWLPRLLGLAADERALPQAARSRFKVGEPQTAPDGTSYIRKVQPKVDTVGQLAVEAANRVVSGDTPEMIAWWYELEKGGRFGFGPEAVKRLRTYVKLNRKARMREMPSASAAVDAVLDRVRQTRPEVEEFELQSLQLKPTGWIIEATIDGEDVSATVSEHGTAELG